MIVICPSCAASNSCPESAAGLTICCRRCKTQITLPEASGSPPPWYNTRYWLAVALVELLALAGLALCAWVFFRGKVPASLPVLRPEETGGPLTLPAPGTVLTLRWEPDLRSAGGHFTVEGQTVTLRGSESAEIPDVVVRQKRWSHEVFEPGQAPAAQPIALEFQVQVPDDPLLAGEKVTLRIAANVEYPGWSRADGLVTLQSTPVAREWTFAIATTRQREAFARYRRGRWWLRVGMIALGVAVLGIALAAGPLAQRHLSVQCPKCGRITICAYYLGGRRLYMSACPHKGSRPVASRRG